MCSSRERAQILEEGKRADTLSRECATHLEKVLVKRIEDNVRAHSRLATGAVLIVPCSAKVNSQQLARAHLSNYR